MPTEESTATTTTTVEGEQAATETFTQADIDRIVRERVARERAKYADYEDLKKQAAGAKTAEDRLAEMEKRTAEAETKALRSDIAAKHHISAEDRDLFLTGTNEETLTAQAKRLAERVSERKKQGNQVPREGTSTGAGTNDPMREFARGLFGRDD